MNRWFSFWSGCGLLFLLTSPAGAQEAEVADFTAPTPRPNRSLYESPQNFAFEIRFGPYRPEIDNEFSGGQQPFGDIFGTKTRYHVGFEIDWQAVRLPYLGTLGPGLGASYTSFSAKPQVLNADGTFQTDGNGNFVKSSDETYLKMFPMYLAAVLRADVFAQEFSVPLVPYAKLGLGWAFWWSGTENGTTRVGPTALVGRGTSWGPHVALGAALQLDFLDRSSALRLDNDAGINHSYFYVEWMRNPLGTFGNNALHVGTSTWVLGLALEI